MRTRGWAGIEAEYLTIIDKMMWKKIRHKLHGLRGKNDINLTVGKGIKHKKIRGFVGKTGGCGRKARGCRGGGG